MNESRGFRSFIKKRFGKVYNVIAAFRHSFAAGEARRVIEKKAVATHEQKIKVDSPLKKIYINSGPKRLNIVFGDFSVKMMENKENVDFLVQAVNFANQKKIDLRIISRNGQADPTIFKDFLEKDNITIPMRYSFYTDFYNRISSPTRRLDVSENDYLFDENEFEKFKEWMKTYEK